VLDRLALVLDTERPERLPLAPDPPTAAVTVIVRRYQPPTADLWRLDTPLAYRWCSQADGAKKTPSNVHPMHTSPARR
jgi:hypothetical protein